MTHSEDDQQAMDAAEAEAVEQGPSANLTSDLEAVEAAEPLVSAPPSPHGEAAELADEWVLDRWAEHYTIDAILLAIPDEDKNPAARIAANPQQGIV